MKPFMSYLPFVIISLMATFIAIKSKGDTRVAVQGFLLHLATRLLFLIPIAMYALGYNFSFYNPFHLLILLDILSGFMYFWKRTPLMKYFCIYTLIFLILGSQMALWIPFGYVLLSYIDTKKKDKEQNNR